MIGTTGEVPAGTESLLRHAIPSVAATLGPPKVEVPGRHLRRAVSALGFLLLLGRGETFLRPRVVALPSSVAEALGANRARIRMPEATAATSDQEDHRYHLREGGLSMVDGAPRRTVFRRNMAFPTMVDMAAARAVAASAIIPLTQWAVGPLVEAE